MKHETTREQLDDLSCIWIRMLGFTSPTSQSQLGPGSGETTAKPGSGQDVIMHFAKVVDAKSSR